MSSTLNLVQRDLDRRYEANLGIRIGDGFGKDMAIDAPVWLYLKSENLSTTLPSTGEFDTVALLDPEIGIIHFFLDYSPDGDIEPAIIRALNHRSLLTREQGLESKDASKVDTDGSWRVVLVWLVANEHRDSWIDRIVAVRETSGFSEELSFDAIFYDQAAPNSAIVEHLFPRLLITLRKVLLMDASDEALLWMSADTRVKEALIGFELKFSNLGERRLARDIESFIESTNSAQDSSASSRTSYDTAAQFSSFTVKNFRCIRSLHFDVGPSPIKGATFFGPNGTGKSSLAEAMSLALFGHSNKYEDFCSDSPSAGLGTGNYDQKYLEQYIIPIDDIDSSPTYVIGSGNENKFVLRSDSELETARLTAASNILSQELSIDFLYQSPEDAASSVLRNYSVIADSVKNQVDRWMKDSNDERQRYLRDLGLSASIKRKGTIYDKLTEMALKDNAAQFPSALTAWLESLSNIESVSTGNLEEQFRQWYSDEHVKRLAGDIVEARNSRRDTNAYIESWLQDYQGLISRAQKLVDEARERFGPIHGELDEVLRNAETWGKWLESQRSKKGIERMPKVKATTTGLAKQREELSRVRRQGRVTRERIAHLRATIAFIDEHWREDHASECPTCNADYTQTGGIMAQLETVLSQTESELEHLQATAEKLAKKTETAQSKAIESGAPENPIGTADQKAVMSALQWLTAASSDFERLLGDDDQRKALIATAQALEQIPAVPEQIAITEELVEMIANRIQGELREADEVFEEPKNWDVVSKRFNETLSDIVTKHLPMTIQQLWHEVVYSLTSASWVNDLKPEMKADRYRTGQILRIITRERLAKYILNRSEAHILGTAWFISQYLLRGRFNIPLMLLDDPAQEMDETTFREYSRFMESFVRLHKRSGRPLTLIHLLHQESRAIAIARATATNLFSFQWRGAGGSKINEVTVIDERMAPQSPLSLFSNS
ncbi:MAG: AAA family ATPase [Armatimonadetes bacterium]|nr:AAA family ATPase [Armatimonadota bacterium]